MKKHIVGILTGAAIALGATTVSAEAEAPRTVSITCDTTGNTPVVKVAEVGSDQQGTMLTFKSDYFSSLEEAQESCSRTATTLQSNYESGVTDKYLAGVDTGEEFAFCVARRGDTCESSDAQELFTVEKREGDYLNLVYADLTEQEGYKKEAEYRGVVRLYSDLGTPWWKIW